MAEPVFTVANQLTMLRMALVPAFVLLTLDRQFTWALVVFVVAGLTDALDGYVARHANQSTRLGAMLDPVADKLLVGSAYVVLTWSSVVQCTLPAWLTVTLLFRDAHAGGRGGGREPDGGAARVRALAPRQGLDRPQRRAPAPPSSPRTRPATARGRSAGSTSRRWPSSLRRPPSTCTRRASDRPGGGARLRRLACGGSRRGSGAGPPRARPSAPSRGASARG